MKKNTAKRLTDPNLTTSSQRNSRSERSAENSLSFDEMGENYYESDEENDNSSDNIQQNLVREIFVHRRRYFFGRPPIRRKKSLLRPKPT